MVVKTSYEFYSKVKPKSQNAEDIYKRHHRFPLWSSLLITAYILSLGISYFILSAAPTGQCQSVQWHSHATPTQHPLMGEQVLDRVQWSRAERAAMIYQMNRPAPSPLARGRGTQPFIKCVCMCVCAEVLWGQPQYNNEPQQNWLGPRDPTGRWANLGNPWTKTVYLAWSNWTFYSQQSAYCFYIMHHDMRHLDVKLNDLFYILS